jgi:DNA polymerase I-like protein with 3'-5' exonuclease and polymerase domains
MVQYQDDMVQMLSNYQSLKKTEKIHQLLVHYTNVVRAFLNSGEGRKIIDADYESLEPHCFASVAGDIALQEIFNNGWDFYSTVAIRTEKLNEDKNRFPDGVSPDKKAPNYLKNLDAPARNKAKAYSLGIAYGMEAYALAKTLDISQKEADTTCSRLPRWFSSIKRMES